MAAEKDFEAHVLGNLEEAEKVLSYRFVALRMLIAEQGAVATAIALLDLASLGHERVGFTLLAKNDLLHRSLEQGVIDFRESGLFPSSIVASARARLLVTRNRLLRPAG